MKIKGQIINSNSISVDKDSKTDELKLVVGEGGTLNVVQGKRAKETYVSEEDGKIYIKSKSKLLWTVDEVKVKDKDGNTVKVDSDKDGYSFDAVVGMTYFITIVHKFRIILIILLGLLALLCLLLSLFLGNPPSEPIDITPQGTYEVGGKREPTPEQEKSIEDNTITFSGYGKVKVSKERPDVEFSNPANNFVNMQFTMTDDLTGDIVVRTDLVAPDNYVYANVMDYYKDKKGEFNTTIQIDTFTDEGQQMNGMTEKMVLIIE